MMPISLLRREHRVILAVLEATEHEARQITRRGTFDAAAVGGFMDFFCGFAHGIHHAREEHYLFVTLGRRLAAVAQIQLVPLLRSHDECRCRLQAIADLLLPSIQGEYWTALSLADQISTYCERFRMHIENEENLLFPLAETVLTPADERALLREFRAFSHETGLDIIRKYRRIARELVRFGGPRLRAESADTPIYLG